MWNLISVRLETMLDRCVVCAEDTIGLEIILETVRLSCIDTNTVSKRTKMRFHMTHVTLEFYRVCQK